MEKLLAEISCSLSTDGLIQRVYDWSLVEGALVDRIDINHGFQWRFCGPEIGDSLHDLVAAERHCCSWASMEVD